MYTAWGPGNRGAWQQEGEGALLVGLVAVAQMGPDSGVKPILGTTNVRRNIGENVSNPTGPEDAVGDKHALLLAFVIGCQQVLCTTNHDAGTWVLLRQSTIPG
jgi:hypothetical protein